MIVPILPLAGNYGSYENASVPKSQGTSIFHGLNYWEVV